MRSSRCFRALDLGPLPAELVNRILQCALPPGTVHFSAANQDHAFGRHGDEFLACLPHVAAAIIAPHYIGQSPLHLDGFEMVREAPDISIHILVAMTMAFDDQGRYAVQSVYQIGRSTVQRRLGTGHLFRVRQWPGNDKGPTA